MSRFFITIPKDLDEALSKLAKEHVRDPQQEASWLLSEAIRAAIRERKQESVVAHGTQD